MSGSFILASKSPRRLELLRQIGIEPVVVPSDYEEQNAQISPEELVANNALGKGLSVLPSAGTGDVVIAADTVVVLDGTILGKPLDAEDAVRMLRALSGRTHRVMTGLAVFYKNRREVAVETTAVTFRRLTEKEILDYAATGEPMDKAGAYGIQGRGAILVQGIEGCYNNVVGLPLTRLYQIFAELDVTR